MVSDAAKKKAEAKKAKQQAKLAGGAVPKSAVSMPVGHQLTHWARQDASGDVCGAIVA